jgi:hypothetical protein
LQTGFFDLGFRQPDEQAAQNRPRRADGKPPLILGRSKSTLPWQLAAWLTLACGIFARQGLALPVLVWKLENVSPGAAIAAIVVGLAVFPMMMRWLNRYRQRAGLEHIASPFAFGFFLDLAIVEAARIPSAFTSP